MALTGEADVQEGGDSLDGLLMLGLVQEVSLAVLVAGVPFEHFECAFARRTRATSTRGAQAGEGGLRERLGRLGGWARVGHCSGDGRGEPSAE